MPTVPRVLITAKAPRPGEVKTRLCPPLGLEAAARLAGALLTDVLTTARTVDPGAGLLAPVADVDDLRRRFPGTRVVPQNGLGLAAALEGAVRDGATLVSGDAPTYPAGLIRRGIDSTADLVIGPALDGGYSLIGMRRFHPAPFSGITWSTGSVLDQTIAAASGAGLTVELLDPHPDVDSIADFAQLDLAAAPATAAVLADPNLAALVRGSAHVVDQTVGHTDPWRRLVVDRLADGRDYAYLATPAAVWIVPVTPAGETVLVRQYRHPVGIHPLEVPAGSIDPGESPAEAAARELREEAGAVGGRLRRVGGFYSSSAHTSLRGLVFLATDVDLERPTHAGTEGIELVRMAFADALDLALRGELCEAQSALSLIYAGRALDRLRVARGQG